MRRLEPFNDMSRGDSNTDQETLQRQFERQLTPPALQGYEGHGLNLATKLNRHSRHQGGTGLFIVSADGVPFE